LGRRRISAVSREHSLAGAKGLREIFRVLSPGGSAWILINYYCGNPHSHQWGELLKVPTHLFAAEEWAGLFSRAGFP
jgi:DNA modification methylase